MRRVPVILRRTVVLAVTVAVVLASAPRDARAQAARDSTARRDSSATRHAPRDTTRRAVVPPDSLPSDDARAVLRTIPEPLTPAEQVAAPADTAAVAPLAPSFAPPDTSAADTSGVPTPAITAPLGESPDRPRRVTPDTTVTEPGTPPPPSSPPGGAPPPPTATAAPVDTCWRLQVAAYDERPVAEAHRVAAASQLLVPMAIEKENGRLKIRSSDCLTRNAAESLRRRAFDSGFPGAFLIRMGANGEAIPVGSPPPAAAPKKPAVRRSTGTPRGAVPSATTPVRKKTVRK